jgi:hypothetical protein
MLPQLGQSKRTITRRQWCWLGVLAALTWALPTVFDATAVAQQAEAQKPAQDREQRLQELEKKIQALQKELDTFRAAEQHSPTTVPFPNQWAQWQDSVWLPFNNQLNPNVQNPSNWTLELQWNTLHRGFPANNFNLNPANNFNLNTVWTIPVVNVRDPQAEINLSRRTYQLPQAKAEALAAFFRDHVKAEVIETQVDGDRLTVTTTPEVQKGIGQLVSSLRKESSK